MMTELETDIIERKRAHEVLEKAKAELELRVEERTAELAAVNERLRGEIIEREEAEDALRRSQARLQHLLTSSPAVIYTCEPGGDYPATFVSENVTSQLGHESRDFVGDPGFWARHVHPEDSPRVFADLSRLFELGHHSHEYRFMHKDGSYRWMHDECTLVRDAAGNPLEIVGYWLDITERKRVEKALEKAKAELELRVEERTAELAAVNERLRRDITERKRAEGALSHSEAKYSTLVEQANDGVIIAQDRVFKFVNKAYADIAGYSVHELVGMDFMDTIPPEDRASVAERYEKRLKAERPSSPYEAKLLCKDGTIKDVEFSAASITYEGRPARMGMVRDISERKQMEEALRESEDRHCAMFEQVADSIALVDAETGALVEFNDRAYETLGYTREEFVKLKVSDFEVIESPEEVAKHLEKVVKEGADTFETKHRTKGGEIRDIEVRSRGLSLQGKDLVQSIWRDITERKRAEDALRESEDRHRAMFEQAADSITLVDAETGALVEFNDRAYESLGYRREEFVKLKISDFEVIESPEEVAKHLEKVVKEGADTFETKHRTKGGEIRDIEVRSRGLSLQGKDLVQSIWRDITERKRAEEALRLYAERLRIVHEIDQAILAVQPLEAIAHVALTQIERLLPCQWASVVELEPERDAAKMVATRIGGKTRNDRGIRLLPEMFGDIGALRQGKVEVVEDVLALSARPAVIQAFGAEEVRSYVSVPLVSQGELFGCLCLGASRPAAFPPNHIEIAREVADELAIAIQSTRLSQQVRDTRRRLEALSHRLLEVQEAERRHMASELHDEIGQMLTGLRLLLEMGTRLPADGVRGKLEEAQELVAELTERVRELSMGLRPAMLDDLGLLPALLWHFERCATQADVRVDFKHAGLQRRFGSEVETGAYRIVQEALTNVARHADVSEVVVRIWADRDTLSLQIEDEGAGFDSEAVLAARGTSGLAGMHERAALLGGQLIVESAPGAGTRVTAELPLRPQAEKRPKKR